MTILTEIAAQLPDNNSEQITPAILRAVLNDMVTDYAVVAAAAAAAGVTGFAPLNSPAFIGNPTAPTQGQLDSGNSLATTFYTDLAVANLSTTIAVNLNAKANAANPSFTGLVTVGGGQIAFPATQNPSANPNTLDDYEEGTFTPTLSAQTTAPTGVTYSIQEGIYTKIGNQVVFSARVTLTGLGASGSGNVILAGLPFVCAGSTNNVSHQSAAVANITFPASVTQLVAGVNVGGSVAQLLGNGSAIPTALVQWSGLAATSVVRISGAYTTN